MSDHPVLQLDRCVVRPFRASDAAALRIAADHPELTFFMRDRMPYPYTDADVAVWLRIARAEGLPPWQPGDAGPSPAPLTQVNLAICLPDDSLSCIGSIGLQPFGSDPTDRRARELGYWVTPAHWGRGIAREATAAVCRWAFTPAGSRALHLPPGELLERIDACVVADNAASARVLTACGFVQEGVRRRAFVKNGVVHDMFLYGLVRADLDGTEPPQ